MSDDGTPRLLYIKNWYKFQHYRERGPTWIKLHRGILSDHDFQALSASDQRHLICLWLIASESDPLGTLPGQILDTSSGHFRYIRDRLSIYHSNVFEVVLARLIESGFITQHDSRGHRRNRASETVPQRTENRDRVREQKPPKPSGAKPAPLKFDLPDWVPASTWNEYLEMRRQIRRPATQAAIRLAVQRLTNLSGKDPATAKAIIEQSIEHSWQGLFDLRQNGNGGQNGKAGLHLLTREEISKASESVYQDND